MIKFYLILPRPLRLLIFAFWLINPYNIFSQENSESHPLDHALFVEELTNSENNAYQEVLKKYDAYIKEHPEDITARIEKCKFIQYAQYDEYEEYNPNQEYFDQTTSDLLKTYPNNPEVLIFHTTFSWGESLDQILSAAEEAITLKPNTWSNSQKSTIYHQISNRSFYNEDYQKARIYINKALNEKENQKRLFLKAKILAALDNKEDAAQALSKSIDSTNQVWELNQKANLFLKLEEYNNALLLFKQIQEKDSTYQNNSEMAKTLEGIQKFEAAREYLVKDTIREWGKEKSTLTLFLHDLKYQSGDRCIESYNAYREFGYSVDPLGIYRLQLFLANPLLPWKIRDILGILTLLIILIVIILLPSIWILPVYAIGHKWKIIQKFSHLKFTWGLKSFWWISIGYLIASFIAIMVEPEVIYSIFNWEQTTAEIIDEKLGKSMLIFIIVLSIFSFTSLSKKTMYQFLPNEWAIGKTILRPIGYFLIYKFVTGLYMRLGVSIFDVSINDLTTFSQVFLSSREDIQALIIYFGSTTGFLLIGILVPIYEELIFRGVILDSCRRYLTFNWANIFQAALFASIHDDLFLFPVFFAFGYIVGKMKYKSNSLLPGIIFHAINNMIAVMVMISRIG